MHIVLTGGTGFIGSQLQQFLVSSGHTVIVYTRERRGGNANILKSCSSVEGSLTDSEKINQLMKQLIIYDKPIIKPSDFYKKIGFTIDEKWENKILKHPSLYKQTQVRKYQVVHRLVFELNQFRNTKQGMCLIRRAELKPECETYIAFSDRGYHVLQVKIHVCQYVNSTMSSNA